MSSKPIKLTVTDVTRMNKGNVCVAGYDPEGRCIRPVIRGGMPERWLYGEDGAVIVRPFATILCDLTPSPRTIPPHNEDHEVNSVPRFVRMLELAQQAALFEILAKKTVRDLFNAPIQKGQSERRWYIEKGQGTRSLGTLQVNRVDNVELFWNGGKLTPHITFLDGADECYRLNPTDLTFRYFAQHMLEHKEIDPPTLERRLLKSFQDGRTVYLRIGLTRPDWEAYPGCCHLQITGIYTFPDYLSGRCFSDYGGASLISEGRN